MFDSLYKPKPKRHSIYKEGRYYKKDNWVDTLCFRILKIDGHEIKAKYYKDGTNQWGTPSDKILHYSMDRIVECNEFGTELSAIEEINKPKKENKMSKVNKNYIGGEYRFVSVSYDFNQAALNLYTFKIDIDIKVKEGDLVVVDSANGYDLCQVHEVIENTLANASKTKVANAWVVNKVDDSRHKEKVANSERLEWIKTQLEEKSKQMESIKMYALLAELDPDAKKLLDEMKSLGGLTLKDK